MADRNSIPRTLAVAVVTSLLCSLLVTTAAIGLKARQEANQLRNQQQNILAVAGLLDPDRPVGEQFSAIETRIVDLASGDYDASIAADDFDAEQAASDPQRSVAIPADEDIARVGRRARHAPVYLVREGEAVQLIILPIHGAGLWAPMHGFLALEPDGRTIHGLRFHEHGETPGLGDKVEQERWLSEWEGKLAYDEDGVLRAEVLRGRVPEGATSHDPPRPGDPAFQIDGMSGATLTGRSVTAIVQFWLGPEGFGPYVNRHWLEAS